jgi:hypothetical protein
MKKLLMITAAALVLTSTAANAWTDQFGHWQEGPAYPGLVPHYSYNPPPYYGHPLPPPYAYGPPVGYGEPIYGPPVVVAPPPTDAQVIAGTVLGIASMFAHGRHW